MLVAHAMTERLSEMKLSMVTFFHSLLMTAEELREQGAERRRAMTALTGERDEQQRLAEELRAQGAEQQQMSSQNLRKDLES